MRKFRFVLLTFILPVFFFSTYGKSWLGTRLEANKEEIKKAAQIETDLDDDEINELLNDSLSEANQFIENNFDYEQCNAGKEYVNFYVEGDESLKDCENSYIDLMNKYLETYPDTSNVLREYQEIDSCIGDLSLLVEKNFSVDVGTLENKEVFVCDQGMVDFISELNGGFNYDLGLDEPSEIVNPNYLDVYSVYENEETSTEEAAIELTGLTQSQIAVSLIEALMNQGLSYAAASMVNVALLSIKNAIIRWMPKIVRASIIVLSIAGLMTIFILYWKQIKGIFEAIVDMFVSVATAFASKIREAFAAIEEKAKKSDYDKEINVDGKIYLTKILSSAYSKEYSEYGKKVYHRAFLFEYLFYVCTDRMEIDKAAAILKIANEPYLHNIYTYQPRNAKNVMGKAFPGARIFKDINCSEKYIGKTVFQHYHADYSSRDGKNHDIKNHSFFTTTES